MSPSAEKALRGIVHPLGWGKWCLGWVFSPGACVCGGWVWFGIDGVLHVHLSGSQDYVEYEFRDKPARIQYLPLGCLL